MNFKIIYTYLTLTPKAFPNPNPNPFIQQTFPTNFIQHGENFRTIIEYLST